MSKYIYRYGELNKKKGGVMRVLSLLLVAITAFSGGIVFSSWQARGYQCAKFEDGSAYCTKNASNYEPNAPALYVEPASKSTLKVTDQPNSTPSNLQPANYNPQQTVDGSQLQGN